jgi:hypothetical protein
MCAPPRSRGPREHLNNSGRFDSAQVSAWNAFNNKHEASRNGEFLNPQPGLHVFDSTLESYLT